MARVKITTPRLQDGVISGFGTTLEIDGVSIRELQDFSLHFRLDGVATVKCQMLVERDFTFEGELGIEPCFMLTEGQAIERTNLGDGRVLYRAVPEPTTEELWAAMQRPLTDEEIADCAKKNLESRACNCDGKCPNPNCVDGKVEIHGPELEIVNCGFCSVP